MILKLYGTFLRNRGYETLMCTSPGEGINSLETESVSLVIVSQDTPAFEGRQVLERSLRSAPRFRSWLLRGLWTCTLPRGHGAWGDRLP